MAGLIVFSDLLQVHKQPGFRGDIGVVFQIKPSQALIAARGTEHTIFLQGQQAVDRLSREILRLLPQYRCHPFGAALAGQSG